MKTLIIEGSFEGYVSMFVVIDKQRRDELLEIDDVSDRLDQVELNGDYIIFSNGVDVESISLSISLDDESLYDGHIKNLRDQFEVISHEDFPAFDNILTDHNRNVVYIRHKEWFEEGSFVHEIGVSDDFKLTDFKVLALDLSKGDALVSGLFKQVASEISAVVEAFEVNGERHYFETDVSNESNLSESFLLITNEGEISPDFDLEY